MAGGFLVIAATLRTINFSLYDYYKLKPNLLVLLTFEITYILIVICTWQSSVDIVILLSVEILTYALWQNNMYILRIGMIITAIVAIIYNILVNAYIAIIGEFVCLIAVIISIIYYDVYKRSTPIIKRLLYYVKPKRKRKRLKARLRKRK